jgi:hypothetical protein
VPPSEPVEGIAALAAMPEITGDAQQLEQVFGNLPPDAEPAILDAHSASRQVSDPLSVRDEERDSV